MDWTVRGWPTIPTGPWRTHIVGRHLEFAPLWNAVYSAEGVFMGYALPAADGNGWDVEHWTGAKQTNLPTMTSAELWLGAREEEAVQKGR